MPRQRLWNQVSVWILIENDAIYFITEKSTMLQSKVQIIRIRPTTEHTCYFTRRFWERSYKIIKQPAQIAAIDSISSLRWRHMSYVCGNVMNCTVLVRIGTNSLQDILLLDKMSIYKISVGEFPGSPKVEYQKFFGCPILYATSYKLFCLLLRRNLHLAPFSKYSTPWGICQKFGSAGAGPGGPRSKDPIRTY